MGQSESERIAAERAAKVESICCAFPKQRGEIVRIADMMRRHDWAHEMSDSPRTSAEGRESLARLRSALRWCPQALIDRMWEELAPERWRGSTPRTVV